jgi:hypothetical protein
MSTAWLPPAVSLRITPAGSPHGAPSSFPSRCSAVSSAASLSPDSRPPFMRAHSSSTEISYRLRNRAPSPRGCGYCSVTTGLSMPNGLSAGQNMCWLSRRLHSSRCHFQQQVGCSLRGQRNLSLARLRSRQQEAAHHPAGRRVPSPLPTHLLPRGFMRIRNFGFLANRRRAELLPLCSRLLQPSHPPATRTASPALPIHSQWQCPLCGGTMLVVERLSAAQLLLRSPPHLSRRAA